MEELVFFDWTILGTLAGAVMAVGILTQLTKNIPGINKILTQVWSYVLALAVLLASLAFGGAWDWGAAALCLINAAMVSLAANGGYEAIVRVKTTKKEA